MIWVIVWYLLGLVSFLYLKVKVTKGDVSIAGFLFILFISCLGPIIPLIYLLGTYGDKVIIKSRK